MAVALSNYDYASLPDEIWLRILNYVEANTLLAIAATASRFRNIVRDKQFTANVVCAPSSDDRTLQRFFTTREMRKVKVLDVSNCIVAKPHIIIYWIATCNALTELRCVNCPLPYTALLIVLMEGLPHLQRMDWSFFGVNFSDDTRRVLARYNERAIPQLRSTYVEVACHGSDNHALLIFLLKRCIVLLKLHLHSLHGDFTETTAMWIGAATFSTTSDPTLVYTTEMDPLRGQQPFLTLLYGRLLQVPSYSSAGATVCGNLVCLSAPIAGVSFSHHHAMPPCVELLRFKQVIVALCNEARVHIRLVEAASEMTWAHIEALTLAILPFTELGTPPLAGPNFMIPLMTFISYFPVLTELNLNSFHFSDGVDCCHILAALPVRLRALSLAPCGINRERSFLNLAKVSSKLEELDVRLGYDNVSLYCASCHQPFRVGEDEAAILRARSALTRFSLCNVVTMQSFDFIGHLRPSELRISFTAWHTIAVTCNIGYLLGWNYNLRSLVLCDRALFRGLMFYQDQLHALRSLRHISLDLSTPSEHGEVQLFFNHMTARLPVLETLHLHYVSGDNFVRTLTWLRQPAWYRETSQEGRQPTGALLADRPCIGCSMATFIGLAKPRNRRHNYL